MDTDSAIIAEKNEQGSLEAGSKQSKKKSKNDVKNLTEQKYDDEEELVITLSEQKYAKMKKKRLKKKKHGQDSAHKVEFSDSKEDDEFKNERKKQLQREPPKSIVWEEKSFEVAQGINESFADGEPTNERGNTNKRYTSKATKTQR